MKSPENCSQICVILYNIDSSNIAMIEISTIILGNVKRLLKYHPLSKKYVQQWLEHILSMKCSAMSDCYSDSALQWFEYHLLSINFVLIKCSTLLLKYQYGCDVIIGEILCKHVHVQFYY